MDKTDFDLGAYLSEGVAFLVKDIVKASFSNPRETAFVARYALASAEARKRRERFAAGGEDIPAFLIASITNRCNLSCAGCYARANDARPDVFRKEALSAGRWAGIFSEAKELGIPFILLAGGEPFVRKDVLEEAAKVKEIMFPVFTNGTMIDGEYLEFLDRNRNLVPLLSIEGDEHRTDLRRSEGVYESLMAAMGKLKERGLLFGVSVTVTTENAAVVTSPQFFGSLYERGCKAAIFVEYVPVAPGTENLAPTEVERAALARAQEKLRGLFKDAIFISFPGDEKYSGGCLAAGRGFFHIGVDGSAEPCPFSPHSDSSLRDVTLREALKSPLFGKLRESGILTSEHSGGCILAGRDADVIAMARPSSSPSSAISPSQSPIPIP